MKIALVLDRFDPGGGGLERWVAAFAGHLVARGHDVHVIAFDQAPHAVPVTTHLVRRGGGAAGAGGHIARTIAALQPDAVYDSGTGWSGDVFHPHTGSRRLSQARLVASDTPGARFRAAISPGSVWRRWQMAWLERLQVRRAGRVVAVSHLVRRELERQHGMAAAIDVIPNGVETARFAPDRLLPLRSQMRDRLGVGAGTLCVVSAHNLRLKGVDTAMRALALLQVGGADVRLAVAGGVPDPYWHGLAAQMGIQGRVSFLGPVAEMEALYAAADIALHPTRWDACSLSTIEAGSAGLPVVTTAANGASELIEHGRTGFVLPDPEDVRALAACLHGLMDPALRRRIGQAAHLASSAHDIRDNFAAIERLLGEAALSRSGDTPPVAAPSAVPGSGPGTRHPRSPGSPPPPSAAAG